MRKPAFAYAKTKAQISFAITAKLISAFVFATRVEKSLYFLNTKFQASSHLLWMYSPVCVEPGRKPRRPVFSQRGSFDFYGGSGFGAVRCFHLQHDPVILFAEVTKRTIEFIMSLTIVSGTILSSNMF